MSFKKASKLASLSVFGIASLAGTSNAFGITCNANNTADLRTDAVDLEYRQTSSFHRMDVLIQNMGPGYTGARFYYNIYSVEEDNSRIALVDRRYKDIALASGAFLNRTILFRFENGQKYEVELEYSCDPNLSNNSLFQRAFNLGNPPDLNEILVDGFESESAAITMHKLASNDNSNIRIDSYADSDGDLVMTVREKEPTKAE